MRAEDKQRVKEVILAKLGANWTNSDGDHLIGPEYSLALEFYNANRLTILPVLAVGLTACEQQQVGSPPAHEALVSRNPDKATANVLAVLVETLEATERFRRQLADHRAKLADQQAMLDQLTAALGVKRLDLAASYPECPWLGDSCSTPAPDREVIWILKVRSQLGWETPQIQIDVRINGLDLAVEVLKALRAVLPHKEDTDA